MRRRLTKCERLEQLIADAFAAMGKRCTHVSLVPATGHYRTSPYADVYRFEGSAQVDGINQQITSWDTMTACVARGITLDADSKSPRWWEVNAKPKSN